MTDQTTEAITAWLKNHQACVDAGVNVGLINQKKAQQFRVELARRDA